MAHREPDGEVGVVVPRRERRKLKTEKGKVVGHGRDGFAGTTVLFLVMDLWSDYNVD